MSNKRPVNLDLTTVKFPPMALVSIGHRISGVIIFILLPVMLCLLGSTLGQQHAANDVLVLHSGWMRFLLWVMLSAVCYHLVAGIRHIIMDFGVGDSLAAGKASAITVFIVAIILVILAGVWIW